MEENMIELIGDDDKKYKFEILAYTREQDELYAILYPTDGEKELYIVKAEEDHQSDQVVYTMVEDQALIDRIYKRFKESNPEGISFQD